MTEQGRVAAAPWRDSTFAAVWTRGDNHTQLLELPRAIAAALVAQDRPRTRTVLDIGSGPGDFLAVFLEEFPDAHGIWLDASEAMLHLAKQRLAPYRDRVEYRLLDMTDLLGRDLPTDLDAIITSRAAHHLDAPGLTDLYTHLHDTGLTYGPLFQNLHTAWHLDNQIYADITLPTDTPEATRSPAPQR